MKRHVCLVSNTLADGGAERWASNTCSYLAAEPDLRISLILFQDVKSYPCPDSVSIDVLDHHHFAHSFRTVRRLRKILIDGDVDVVISNGSFTGQFVGQAMRGADVRWVARISGNIAEGQQTRLQRLGWRWLDHNISRTTRIVANSRSMAAEVQSRWPRLSNRMISIPNGVDIGRLSSLSEQPPGLPEAEPRQGLTIIGAGRLHSQKRPDVFVQAVHLLQSSFDVTAYWCGDGPLRDETERHIVELGLKDRVTVTGFREDLPAWIRRADCFVMTSDHEGSPNVLAEAMALGVPVVSTDCAHGPSELLADDRGWLAPVGDAAGIADAVSKVASHPEEAKRRASSAHAWIQQNLSMECIGNHWKQLIEEHSECVNASDEQPPGRTF